MADLKKYKAMKAVLNQRLTVKHIKIVALKAKVGNSSPAARKGLPVVWPLGVPHLLRGSLGIKNESSSSNRTKDDTLEARIEVNKGKEIMVANSIVRMKRSHNERRPMGEP
jgi:hypothetical protein